MTRATTADREARLRRSLRRLGYDLVDADSRGYFHIRREGSKINEMPDLFGLDLAGAEVWTRGQTKRAGLIMSNALAIARAMTRQFEAGKSLEETIAAISRAFPSATSAELRHACRVGRDQMA